MPSLVPDMASLPGVVSLPGAVSLKAVVHATGDLIKVSGQVYTPRGKHGRPFVRFLGTVMGTLPVRGWEASSRM